MNIGGVIRGIDTKYNRVLPQTVKDRKRKNSLNKRRAKNKQAKLSRKNNR